MRRRQFLFYAILYIYNYEASLARIISIMQKLGAKLLRLTRGSNRLSQRPTLSEVSSLRNDQHEARDGLNLVIDLYRTISGISRSQRGPSKRFTGLAFVSDMAGGHGGEKRILVPPIMFWVTGT